jgi:hypothetical protein
MTDETHNSDIMTPAHIESLITCMESIHQSFDTFFEMDIQTLRNLPNLFYVRNAYAAVALIKMEGVLCCCKSTRFESLFARNLKVEQYLDTMIQVLERVADCERSRIAISILFVFIKLKSWYLQKQGGIRSASTLPADWEMLSSKDLAEELNENEHARPPSLLPAEALSTQKETRITPASTTNFEQQNRNLATDHLWNPFAGQECTPGSEDRTMFNLGLPQFYDFGFAFDDMDLPNYGGEDLQWMGFAM